MPWSLAHPRHFEFDVLGALSGAVDRRRPQAYRLIGEKHSRDIK